MDKSLPLGVPDPDRSGSNAAPMALFRFLLLAAILVVALLGFLGGAPSAIRTTTSPAADLVIDAPATLRNGNLFEMRLDVVAHSAIDDAVLAVPEGLWREVTVNSMIPAADKEESKDGEFRFHFGAMKAGERLQVKLDGQLNPPLFGSISGPIRLLDGDRALVTAPYNLKVIP